jgi:glycosyltransferase involved in cell wall biosynthesis
MEDTGFFRLMMVLEATTGGTARHVTQVAIALRSLGIDVHLVCAIRRDVRFLRTLAFLRKAGVSVTELDMHRAVRPFHDIWAIWNFRQIMTAVRPHIVHLHSSKAGFIGRSALLFGNMSGARVIYTPHAYAFLDGRRVRSWCYRAAERLLARWTNCIIAVSESEFRLTQAMTVRCRVTTVPNGVEELPELCARPPESRHLRIGWLGRMERQKQPAQAIRAASVLDRLGVDFCLSMAGEGLERVACDRLARNLDVVHRIVFPGYLEDVSCFYREIDVFLSTSRYEGMSYAMLDAMAHAIPVVAFDAPGASDLVSHGETGLLAPVGDIGCLAAHLERMAHDRPFRLAAGMAGRARVNKLFRAECAVEKLLFIYREILWQTEYALVPAGS